MPNLQELVNRNRGVTVYNPVRPILPRASTANAGTFRRILEDDNPEQRRQSAGGMQSFGSGEATIPQQQLPAYQEAVAPVGYAPGALLARVQAGKPPEQEQPGGWRGALGTAIGSGPGQFIMGALNVLDYPRRAVASTLQETVDLFSGEGFSWDDFTTQLNDPEFGFGDIIGDATGNKWVNRFLGFAGDVLLDPLTYVAGASLITGTGRSARIGTATAARAAGVSEELAQRIGRYGMSALDNAERQVLRDAGVAGVRDAGYYFRVPFGQRIRNIGRDNAERLGPIDLRIPGTGGLERGVSRGFAGVRASVANTRAGDALRRWRTPQGQEEAWRKILTGEGNIGFNEAAALVTFADTRRLAQHAFTSRLNAEAQAAMSEAAGTFGRERTGNRALSELIHQAETQGGTPVNRIFDAALEMMREVGITRPGRKNYVPHQITEGALQWLRSDASPEARYIRETFFGGVNLDDISPSMMERRLVPGADPDKPYIINGKEFYIREGTIKEMNEQFAKLVPNAGFKFFEDDFSAIIARYSKSMAEDVGMVAGARRLINSKGNFVRRVADVEDLDATEEVLRDVLNRYADPEISDRLLSQLNSQSERVQQLRESIEQNLSDAQEQIAVQADAALQEIHSLDDAAKARLQELLRTETGLVAEIPGGRPRGLFGPAEPGMPTELEVQLAKQLETYDEQIAALADEAMAIRGGPDVPEFPKELTPEQVRRFSEIQRLHAELKVDQKTLESIHQQVIRAREVAARFDEAADNPSLLNSLLGEPQRAEPVSRIERRPVNKEHAIRNKYQRERDQVLPRLNREAAEATAAVQAQADRFARVQEELDDAIRRHKPQVSRARNELKRQYDVQQALRDEAEAIVGDPAQRDLHRQLSLDAYEHRSPGGLLDQAKRRLEAAESPIKAVQARLRAEQEKLNELIGKRNYMLRQQLMAGVSPGETPWVMKRLREIDQREAAEIAAARKTPEFDTVVVTEPRLWGRDRRWAEEHYEDLPYMDPEARAELVDAYRIERDADRTTDAGKAQVREARATIKRLNEEWNLTPRQRQMRAANEPGLNEAIARIEKLHELRVPWEPPPASSPKGKAVRQAPKGRRGGDNSTGGMAARALKLAKDELGELADEALEPAEMARRMLDHDLVRSGVIDSKMLGGLVERSRELETVAKQYSAAPLPHHRQRVQQLTRDVARDTEMMARLRLAQEAGIEVDDRVATYIAHRQLMWEDRILGEQIERYERALNNPTDLRRQTQYEMAHQEQVRRVKEARTEHAKAVSERKEAIAAIKEAQEAGRPVTADMLARKRLADNALNRTRNAARRAEKKFFEMRPPALGVVGDDIDTMTFMIEQQVRDLAEAEIDIVRAERYEERLQKRMETKLNPGVRSEYLETMIPSRERTAATFEERARRIRAAIQRAERDGSDTVRWISYEPTAAVEQAISMPLMEAHTKLANTNGLARSFRGQAESYRLELAVMNGDAQVEFEKLQTLLRDQKTPPDVDSLRAKLDELDRTAAQRKLTKAEHERRGFLHERLRRAESAEPMTLEEAARIVARRDRLKKAISEYNRRVQVDEVYAARVREDSRAYFERLLNGERDVTRRDMRILVNVLGGEEGVTTAALVDSIKQALKDRETISLGELNAVLDEVGRMQGSSTFAKMMADSTMLDSAVTSEMIAGAEEISVGTVNRQMARQLVGMAEAKRRKAVEDLAGIMRTLGITFREGEYSSTVLRALGLDLNAVKRQASIVRGDTIAHPVDTLSIRNFVTERLTKLGYVPEVTLRHRINDLKLAQHRVRNQRRGLGAMVVSEGADDPAVFSNALARLQSEPYVSPEREIQNVGAFKELLPPQDMEQLYHSHLARLRDELREATANGDADAIAELNRRIDEIEAGAVAEGIQPVEGQVPAEQIQVGQRPEVDPVQRDAIAAERQSVEDQLAEIDAQIADLQSATDVGGFVADSDMAERLREAQRRANEFIEQFDDLDNMTDADMALEQEMLDDIFRLRDEARQAGMADEQINQILQNVDGAPVRTNAAELGELQARREVLQGQLDELDNQIDEFGLTGGDPELPPPTDPGPKAPDEELVVPDSVPDTELSLEQIDAEYDEVLSAYNEIKKLGDPSDPATDPQIADEAARLASRARQLRELRRERLGDAPAKVSSVDEKTARRVSAEPPVGVTYNWRRIWASGQPTLEMARTLADIERQATRTLAGTVGWHPPSRTTPFWRDSLLDQIEKEEIVLREQERLRSAAGRYRQEATELEGQVPQLTERIAATEAELGQQQAALDSSLGVLGADEQSRLAAIESRRRAVIEEKAAAEDAYTKKLSEIDQDLAEVRIKIQGAQAEADRLGFARTRIDELAKGKPPKGARAQDYQQFIDDFRDFAANLDQVPENVATSVVALLDAADSTARRLAGEELSYDLISQRLADFERQANSVAAVTKQLAADGFREFAKDLVTGPDSMYMAESIATGIKNLETALRNHSTWKLISGYTNFFKTYATMRPGFHVRNLMSGIFMNLVDNVQLGSMWRAMREYRKFKKNPSQYWASADQKTRDAFMATWGSGAGGQFQEFGIGNAGTAWGRGQHRLMNNFLTRMNRKGGEFVEGTLRLGMALDSMARGESVEQALARITKFHFDYTQVSSVDRVAKQLIPFWTFMSRNIPLQLESMWLRPRSYLQYQSFVRNFAENADPLTPDYWLAQGAFTMDENVEDRDAPWYVAFDLPHLRVAEPFEAIAQGEVGKALMQDLNPALLAPYEAFIRGSDVYTGRPIEGYEEPTGPMTPLLPLLQLLGATETGGRSGDTVVDQRYAHALRSLLPPLDQIERLANNSGTREGRRDETWLRNLGAPVYKLTDNLRDSTRRRQYYERRDEENERRDLARM